MGTAWLMKNETFSLSVKSCQGVSVSGDSNNTHESGGPELIGDACQLAQQAGIVGLVVGIGSVSGGILFVSGEARRTNARRAA